MEPAKTLIVIGRRTGRGGACLAGGDRLGLGLGHLPGDIVIERGDFRLYLPLGTCAPDQRGLTLIFWVLGRL